MRDVLKRNERRRDAKGEDAMQSCKIQVPRRTFDSRQILLLLNVHVATQCGEASEVVCGRCRSGSGRP